MTRPPSPAIVTQAAVRTLPRALLWGLCLVYVCAGFVGRHAWKNEDVAAYGFMQALAQGRTSWLQPDLVGLPLDAGSGLLHIWLGALALMLRPDWIGPEFAVRVPFIGLVLLSFTAMWWATYYLARRDQAQPVPFAFGGEAKPVDYARTIADGSVLALIACFGVVQFSHETTASVVQLFGASLWFLALALTTGKYRAHLIAPSAIAILFFSGAAVWLLFLLASGVLITFGQNKLRQLARPSEQTAGKKLIQPSLVMLRDTGVLVALSTAAFALRFDLSQFIAWPLAWPTYSLDHWHSLTRLLIWFGWPAWPLAAWAVYRWRAHIFTSAPSYHLALPLWFVLVTLLIAVCTEGSARDRTLFLSLPMAATLAAFALPTLRRSFSALIDWFTLLFFTACGGAIWVIWTATQTGVPAKPAANVAKLAPEYVPQFSMLALVLALLATAVWLAAIVWRTGRHRAALWKSLVLPAGGSSWCVLLVMTLWLPMLDYGRSYVPQIEHMHQHIPSEVDCIWSYGLSAPQLAAFWAQAEWPMQAVGSQTGLHTKAQCDMAMVPATSVRIAEPMLLAQGWQRLIRVERPTSDEAVILFTPQHGGTLPVLNQLVGSLTAP